jgi:rhamnosyltransferase
MKVAAYITAYKDYAAVCKCIQAISKQSYQVIAVLVLDNSPVSIIHKYDSIVVSHHPENIGIGEGLMIGIRWAISQGYEFLWVFDQDSVPTPNCLETLVEAYEQISGRKDYNIGIIAPTPIDPRTHKVVKGGIFVRDRFIGCKHNSQVEAYECDAPITSGSLISIAAAKTISLPRADLFIDGVDLDYGMRLRQKGFYNLIVPSAVMQHSFGNPVKVKILRKERYVHKYSALRHYYICRNHTYLNTRYAEGLYCLTSCLRCLKYMLFSIVAILLYDSEDKALKVWACLLGTYHGLKGKLGKTWQ